MFLLEYESLEDCRVNMMMKAIVCISLLASIFGAEYARAAQSNNNAICEPPLGMVVPTADTAQEIYEAVLKGRGDALDPRADVQVSDNGEFWTVFQRSEGRGGGLLELEISKCDGAVRGSYSR